MSRSSRKQAVMRANLGGAFDALSPFERRAAHFAKLRQRERMSTLAKRGAAKRAAARGVTHG